MTTSETKDQIQPDDWRLQTFSRLAKDWLNPWSGKVVPKGSRVTVSSIIQLTKKKQLTIPLPNASALLINASALAYDRAKAIRDSSGIDQSLHPNVNFKSDEDAFNYLEGMIEAIVLAFTALEAFANESIPSDFAQPTANDSAISMDKATLERKLSLDEKFASALPSALNCASPKGKRVWQDFKQLKDARDRVVHMKSTDRKSAGAEVDTVWKAILLAPTPHHSALSMIGHFIPSLKQPPLWFASCPYRRPIGKS